MYFLWVSGFSAHHAPECVDQRRAALYFTAAVDSTGSVVSQTDKYPFKTFNATIDLAGDHIDADYMIGPSATVVASGKTYPDYTSY